MLRTNRYLIYVEIYLIEKEDINELISYLKEGGYKINYYQLVVQIFNHLEIIILLFEELLSIVLFPLNVCLPVS